MAVILLGMVFSIRLLTLTPKGVFYSGDGGIKYLMTRQFSQGRVGFTLDLAAPNWVRAEWDRGHYPFAPPFVYRGPRGAYPTFPIYFPLLCAPFFRLLGFYGLFVVPTLSCWLLWLRFRKLAIDLGLSRNALTIWLSALIFTSPLAFYGALFWEHTLGALLVFLAVEYLVLAGRQEFSAGRAFLLGLAGGFSVWVRSENYLLAGIFFLAAVVYYLRFRPRGCRAYLLGLGLPVAALWAVNLAAYGSPLGAHSFEVMRDYAGPERSQAMLEHYRFLFSRLGLLLPPLVFILAALPAGLGKKLELPRPDPVRLMLLVSLVFLLLLPLITPHYGGKQWGPRFALGLAPLLCLAGAMLQERVRAQSRIRRGVLWALLAVSLTIGVYFNTYLSSIYLRTEYADKVSPLLVGAGRPAGTPVLVSHQFAAQEIAYLLDEDPCFLIRSAADLDHLSRVFAGRGLRSFFVIQVTRAPFQPGVASALKHGTAAFSYEERFLGRRGVFDAYLVDFSPSSAP